MSWEEDLRGKVPFSPNHSQGIHCQHDLSLFMLTLVTGLRECLSDFTTVKLLFLPLRPHYLLWKEIAMHSLLLRSRMICSTWLRTEYLHALFGILPRGRSGTDHLLNVD